MVEAGRNAVIDIPALKWPEIKRARFRYLGYDGRHKTDLLTALFLEDCPAVYAAVDDALGIRYDPETGRVAGVEIKRFEDSFLCQRHSELADEWAAVKPEGQKGIHSSGWMSGKGAVGLTRRLQEIVKDAATSPAWAARQAESLAEYREYMAFLKRQAEDEPPALKWPEVRRVMYWYTGVLDDGLDTDSLMVLFAENRKTMINADTGERGEMMICYDTNTGEVIALEIEPFESHFLKLHPELADGWTALKPEGDDGFHNSPWLTGEAALDYARRLKDLAYQGTLAPGWPAVDRGDILLWSKFGVPD